MVDFDGQREGEKVLLVFRRHMSVARRGFFILVICLAIGLVPFFIWPNDASMIWVFLAFLMVGGLCYGYSWMLWYFSVYVLTNERLRVIMQRGLFKKQVLDVGLERIESIEMVVPGMMGGIFGYGTIMIHMTSGDLVISKVKKPQKVYNRLQDAFERNRKGK